jgi:hypothetical protein
MTDYDRFRRATPEQKPREEFVVWAFVKNVRTFTGSLRAIDDEHDLMRTRGCYFV